MNQTREQQYSDMQLLSDAITALNISRHKVGVYPQGHPEIDASLQRTFEAFQRLFKKRDQVILAAAKDVLHIDEYPLDKGHPVYQDMALCLNARSIASVTFTNGLTKEELQTFNRFLLQESDEVSTESLEEEFNQYNLSHIKAEFIDYEAFSFAEGRRKNDNLKRGLWVRYVQELISGNLRSSKYPVIREIPPDTFARLINAADTTRLNDEASDRVITTYLWQSLEKVSWITDINKMIRFINRLRPGLQKQFLSSSFRSFPKEIRLGEDAFKELPVDEAIEFLDVINENRVEMPEAIKNLIEKLSSLTPEGFQGRSSDTKLIIDDIPLPYDFTPIAGEDDFKKFVNDFYTEELQSLLTIAAEDVDSTVSQHCENEWDDETVDKDFNQVLLELIASSSDNLIIEQDHEYFNNLLKDQIEYFIGTGQYDQVLKIFGILKARSGKQGSPFQDINALPPDTLVALVDSFRIMGGRNKEYAMELCRYCRNRIAPPLLDALINEESRKIRKFLLDLIIPIADEAVPEAIKCLDDKRWFVKRNMLFILSESSSREALPYVRPYCYHDNLKLSFHALKYMLRADERYGIEVLKGYLRSGTSDKIEMALIVSGAFSITAIVPELISMLSKMAKRGLDWEQKIPIVRALGQIGDPRALNALKVILGAKSILFRNSLRKLKEEVVNSLKHYPPEEVRMVIGIMPGGKSVTGTGTLDGAPSAVAGRDTKIQPGDFLMSNQEVSDGH